MKIQSTPIAGLIIYVTSCETNGTNKITKYLLFGPPNLQGCYYVMLRNYKPERCVCVHMLVAEEFAQLNIDKSEVLNANIQWVSQRENIRRALRLGNHPASPLYPAKHKNSENKSFSIDCDGGASNSKI